MLNGFTFLKEMRAVLKVSAALHEHVSEKSLREATVNSNFHSWLQGGEKQHVVSAQINKLLFQRWVEQRVL